ncbi:hypothetical protein ABGN05_24495 [Aquibium sp. LZ166]|uniref:Uncharacterized protein n=1 Tax=Aquibium pacificus TaxID=3153579 RepID=A0ABV3SPT8_9HYPH
MNTLLPTRRYRRRSKAPSQIPVMRETGFVATVSGKLVFGEMVPAGPPCTGDEGDDEQPTEKMTFSAQTV